MNHVFTLDSVFLQIGSTSGSPKPQNDITNQYVLLMRMFS